jgi:hypothetical protein
MNLRQGGGKVPVLFSTEHEARYVLLEFPTWEEFKQMYSKHKSEELKGKYWNILRARVHGKTLEQAGKSYGITRERVRQIEARFQRLVRDHYTTQIEANLSILCAHQTLVESFSDSVMLENSPLADDNR